MMDLNKAGTGATVDELLVSAKKTLSMAEQHYAAYEKIPLDARQDALRQTNSSNAIPLCTLRCRS
ncbi:Serine chemoreceptor protein [Serratia fonticola]|uniref:Serine chemoreceptor protein n=1 Tax=Serratia fonticola TaxID=47917 RepID=A0A4U9WJZ9_SERFO|nr:Serine chemoreceptor protein [Serratia fonticola]